MYVNNEKNKWSDSCFCLQFIGMDFLCVSIAMSKWIKGEGFKRNVKKEKIIHRILFLVLTNVTTVMTSFDI